jgi:Tol biopolymer transport system component
MNMARVTKNRLLLPLIVVLVTADVQSRDQNNPPLDKLFASAQHRATVAGDLNGAIDEYRRIVATAGADRSAAARALLGIADCYRQLGDTAAEKRTYQQIARDFADQREAARTARKQLESGTSTTAPAVRGDRAVWSGADVGSVGAISPDGRYLTYVDWAGAENLMVRDLATSASRALTTNRKPGETGSPITATWSAISHNGSRVAFAWKPAAARDFELRVADLHDSKPNSRVIATFGDRAARAADWSPDETLIATVIENADNTLSLGVTSMKDGTFRQLKSMGWGAAGRVLFSPDGRYLAYDFATADTPYRRDLTVISIEASAPVQEVPLVADGRRNYLMGWSPSGELLYSSDRSGTRSLWAVRVAGARATGDPRLVRENVLSTEPVRLTPAGTLYVVQNASPMYVQTSGFDARRGRLRSGDSGAFQYFVAGNGDRRSLHRWSWDGRYLAFTSCADTCALLIRDEATGGVREVPHTLSYFQSFSLAPDGHAVVGTGEDLKGRSGVYLIDTTTGATELVARGMLTNRHAEWSVDGRAILYRENRGETRVLVERNVADGRTRDVYQSAGNDMGWIRLSPDGRMVALVRHPAGNYATQPSRLIVAPLSGGPERILLTATGLSEWQWSADSQSLTAAKAGDAGIELWQVPMIGDPRKLEIDAAHWSSFHISSDGTRIVFTAHAGDSGSQLWALENVLPRR